MAFKSRNDLVGKRFLCIYANHCSDYSDTNNNNSKTTNSNQTNSSTQLKQQQKSSSKDCTERCSNSIEKLKSTKISDWNWKRGIIRACTHRNPQDPDLSVSDCLKLKQKSIRILNSL
jgi:hypothetical protein